MGKKLITILHTESSIGWGGQEIRILLEAQLFARKGYRVLIACQPNGRLAVEAEAAGMHVYRINMPGHFSLRAKLELMGIMKSEGVGILNTHSSIDSWLASPAAKLAGIPVIRTRHLMIPVKNTLLVRLIYKGLCDRIITTGESTRKMLSERKIRREDKIVSIPTGVDVNKFNPGVSGRTVRDEFGIKPDQPLIGIVAVVRHWKGHLDFIDAAGEVIKANPDSRFLVVGELSEKKTAEKLYNKIRELKLEHKVFVTGYRTDIPEIISSLDILISCSTGYEGVSQSILQALAMEKPVIATAAGSSGEAVIDGKTGILVKTGDSSAISRNALMLIKDRETAEKLGRAGRLFVSENFGLQDMAAKIEDIYRELIQ